MTVTECLVTLLFAFLVKFIIEQFRKPPNFPPGPPRFPIIGSFPFLKGKGVEKFVGNSVAAYGPVTGLFAFSYPMVMINDWKLAKTLFAREEFSGRPSNYTTKWARSPGGRNLGVVMTEGGQWLGQRNFTVKQLKNFGFGKKDLEGVIVEEARDLVEYIDSLGGLVKVNDSLFYVPVLNVLWNMVVGYSLKRDDEEMKSILKLISYVFTSKIFVVAMAAPWVRFVFPSLTGYNKRLDALKGMRNHIQKEIEKHELDLDEQNPRDFIDSYLIEIKNNPDTEFCKEQLVMIGMDLMAAGSETSSTTLKWVILYLVLYPDVQEKCYKEIEDQNGESSVRVEDTGKLNFCQATIAEIQRVSEVAVSSLQHRVTEEVTLPSGHVIPEGSLAMSNIKKFLSDPLLWDSPSKFTPERFLDSSGNFFRPEHFVPLGHGRRVCMGEPLARAELFIFFVTLVQRIKFEAIEGRKPDPRNYSVGVTKSPNEFTVKVLKRIVI